MPRSSGTGSVPVQVAPDLWSAVHGVRWPNATDAPLRRTCIVGPAIPPTVTVAAWRSVTVPGVTVTHGPPSAVSAANTDANTTLEVCALLRMGNHRDRHAVIGRSRVGEQLAAALDRALEHQELPQRVGLGG